jgi:8-amino-7-oxononanoate synthase
MTDLPPSWLDELPARLAELDAADLTRRRRRVRPADGASLVVDGREMLAFCSNDYLGLSRHPALAEAAAAAARRYGVGSGASPMVSGHSEANAALEEELAEFVGLPRALYFYAGYSTNAGVVPALVGPGDALFSDALNHACLIDGARLSKATLHRFAHADLGELAAQLAASPARRKLVISDAVFSMDGDVADVPALLALCERHDALLMLDDAHGFGVLGPQGRGTLAAAGFANLGGRAAASRRVLYMATLGKAAGVSGAFVAGPDVLVEWVLQKTRSYIFATAAPALLAESLRAALRVMQAEPAPLARLHDNIARFKAGVPAAIAGTGWTLLPSSTAVQALVIGSNAQALEAMRSLADDGLWVPAIRPPTVAEGTARLRIALSAAHTAGEVDRLLAALGNAARRCAA